MGSMGVPMGSWIAKSSDGLMGLRGIEEWGVWF